MNFKELETILQDFNVPVLQYLQDGLTKETILEKIKATWYDPFGRVMQKYLPYTDGAETGAMRTDASAQQPAFYNSLFANSENYFYSNSIVEASPET